MKTIVGNKMATSSTGIKSSGYKTAARIDIQVEVQLVEIDDLASKTMGESSADIRRRVIAARAIQEEYPSELSRQP